MKRSALLHIRARALSTDGFSWIKRPLGQTERKNNRPATREIEQLRADVITLLDWIESTTPPDGGS